jgi:putative endonuclease
MAFFTYIIQSQTTARYYCGSSSDVERRLRQHNDSDYKGSRTTKIFPGPWNLVWAEAFRTRGEAMDREKQIKKRGIKRFVQDNPAGGNPPALKKNDLSQA